MYEFLTRFHPRIIDVFHRELEFWNRQSEYVVNSVPTKVRSLLYVHSGEGILEFDGTFHPLTAGCAFQFPVPSEMHLHSSTERPLFYYTVQYDYKLVDWDGATARCLDPEATLLPIGAVIQMEEAEVLHDRMRHLYETWMSKKEGFAVKTKLEFLSILLYVYEHQSVRNEVYGTRLMMLESANYIREHYEEPLSRELLAERVALSPSYFSIVFKRHTGCTPMQFITQVRLEKARQMLRETNKPVAEIAREVGFRDPLYFTRVFSQEVGMSPREYRNG
jgi:AraC-like DNA-binding protein